jgi:biopolymer transport protein ExbB/TolQ
VVLFFFWSITILFFKSRKLRFQREALALAAVPQQPDFVLTPTTARAVLDRIYTLVDDTRHFLLLNRIERALSNLQNIGQVNEVSDILRTQAEYDEEQLTSSYGLLNGFVWAIPVLGFIGTVLGLSQAIAAFGGTLETANDLSVIKDSLKSVTGGLANAFETTLIALMAALIIQLLLTFLQQAELEFLDECNDYCHSHVVSKLRLVKNV